MTSHSTLILLIVAISLATLTAGVYLSITQSAQPSAPEPVAQIRILQISMDNITDNIASHVRIQVTSDTPVRINDTQIRLHTQGESAYLAYRDGALTQDAEVGFITQ